MSGPTPLLSDSQAVQAVLEGYQELLPVSLSCEPRLAGVIGTTLAGPGSMGRAQLAYGIATALGADAAEAVSMGTAVEYFHTASLLLDDLPCMDDATQRRGMPCPHTVFGEGAAILGALAFINRAYQLVGGLTAGLDAPTTRAVWDLVGSCLGGDGVLQGQSLDLHTDYVKSKTMVQKVARGKTVTVLRLALLLPALRLGASADVCRALEALAENWGLAYQIIDDFKDLRDGGETGKTSGRDQLLQRPNMVLCCGEEEARALLDDYLTRAETLVQGFGEDWAVLRRLQDRLAAERLRVKVAAAA